MGNQTQLKYAVQRLDEELTKKVNKIREELTTPAEPLTASKFIKLIKAGKIKPIEENSQEDVGHVYGRISNIFTVEGLSVKAKADEPKIKSRSAVVYAEYTNIKDEMMLGDLPKALALLKAFAAKKF